MARRTRRPSPTHQQLLEPLRRRCPQCEGPVLTLLAASSSILVETLCTTSQVGSYASWERPTA